MKHFEHVASHIRTAPLLRQVEAHPELWNRHPARTGAGGSFDETSDLWVRFRDPAELVGVQSFTEPHFSVFYPAWHVLTELHQMVWDMMARERATMLGGILLTKIPPGCQVKPHHDRGRWHAEFYNRKIYIPLKTNERCVNRCEDELVVMRVGEGWFFNNLVTHSVVNDGEDERITAIICLRTE